MHYQPLIVFLICSDHYLLIVFFKYSGYFKTIFCLVFFRPITRGLCQPTPTVVQRFVSRTIARPQTLPGDHGTLQNSRVCLRTEQRHIVYQEKSFSACRQASHFQEGEQTIPICNILLVFIKLGHLKVLCCTKTCIYH